jgi:glycosyltransferase involved in cell wall biosynthesis
MSYTEPLATFVGSNNAVNVHHVINNLDAMLPGEHHLITTSRDLGDTNFTRFGKNNSDTLLGSIQALSEYLQSHSPKALLQITDPPVHGTIAGALAYRHDVPFVYRYSGDRFYEYRVARGRERLTAFTLGAALGRIPIRLATRHITLGPVGKRRLIARGVPPGRIAILPPAVDPTRFNDPDPIHLDVPANRKLVLFVGRLSHLKGAETLERIIPRVLERRNDLQFVCVGSVERDLDVPENVREHVTSVGTVSPEIVPNYMAAADLLVHPTLTEGVPRVLLESLAAETPVLARDVGDVASVTDNTFDSEDELEDRLTNLESIPLDDISPFTSKNLEPVYRDFFEGL